MLGFDPVAARVLEKGMGRAVIIAVLAAVGCGADDESAASTVPGGKGGEASGGTGAHRGAVAAGGVAGSEAGSGGVAGIDAGSGTGGSSGSQGDAADAGAESCAAGWGDPAEHPAALYRAAPGLALASPTLSPDELEIIFAEYENTGTGVRHFRRAVRDSVRSAFTAGEIIAELDTVCFENYNRSIDLSSDGLHAYIGCADIALQDVRPLRIARRAAVGAPFVLDPRDYGVVGVQPAIGLNGLVAFANSQGARLMVSTRTSDSAAFGAGTPVPGLESTTFGAADPTANGLWLFGTDQGSLIAAGRDRPEAPFSAPRIVRSGYTAVQAWASLGDPEISLDCRRLYYVWAGTEFGLTTTFTIRVLTR